MIKKWLNQTIQWFKMSKQKQSSTTVKATEETLANPSETLAQAGTNPATNESKQEPANEPVSNSPSEEQTVAEMTPTETTEEVEKDPNLSTSSATDLEKTDSDNETAVPQPNDSDTGIDPSRSDAESKPENGNGLETENTSGDQKEKKLPASTDAPQSATENSKTATEKTQVSDHLKDGQFHYQDGDFIFSMPAGEEERQVLKEADAKVEEALAQLAAENGKQQKHWEAKRFWSLQIYYRDRAQHFYKQRNQDPEALAKAISYCEKMIRYAPMAIHINRLDPLARELPQHHGYKQLAIIREREGNLNEAIRLCQQAMDEGWKGDWPQRLERYRKKLDASAS